MPLFVHVAQQDNTHKTKKIFEERGSSSQNERKKGRKTYPNSTRRETMKITTTIQHQF